jgi:hypothetical protein
VDIGKLFRDAWGLFVKDIGPLIVGMLIASIIPTVAAIAIGAATVGTSISGLQVDSQGTVTGVDSVNWALLVIGGVAILVVALFLTVPLYVGILSGVIRRVREGRQMAYGDAFSGFGLFGRVVWAAVLLSLIFAAIFLLPAAVIAGGAAAGSGILVGLGVLVLLAAMVPYAYLLVAWAYVFPVIVDRGVGVTESMAESRRLVHGTGWWWTFLMLFVLQLVVGAVSAVLGLIPLVGAVATIALYPFVLTYVVAMYFQARGEGQLIDAVLGWPRQAPAGSPAYSSPAAPYSTAPAPPAPPYVGQAAAYAPAPPPVVPPPAPDAVTATTVAGPGPAPVKADADAWKAAADPLAAQPPAARPPAVEPPPVEPAMEVPAPPEAPAAPEEPTT